MSKPEKKIPGSDDKKKGAKSRKAKSKAKSVAKSTGGKRKILTKESFWMILTRKIKQLKTWLGQMQIMRMRMKIKEKVILMIQIQELLLTQETLKMILKKEIPEMN
jgi:hypothetical protein